jgi:DNA mismatch repair protein MutS
MVIDEYIDYHDRYVAKFGPQTFVAYQCGDFYEAYAYPRQGATNELCGADIYTVADICNWQVTRKNKSIPECSRANPLMAGVPLHAFQKHAQTLVSQGWTIVVVSQVSPPPAPRREVTEILSPSTCISAVVSAESNYLLAFYWDVAVRCFALGVAGVDVSTGHTFTHEVASRSSDPSYAFDEATRIMTTYQPKEIVVYCSDDVDEEGRTLIRDLLPHRCAHYIWSEYNREFHKPVFQNLFLSRAYSVASQLSPLEIAGLERFEQGRVAFVLLLQFAHEHDDRLIAKLLLPDILTQNGSMTLEYNSAVQLNLTSTGTTDRSLLNILNRCATAVGRRLFRERLLSPITDTIVLEARYAAIDELAAGERYKDVLNVMGGILDIERITRRMGHGTLAPCDWINLHQSLEAAREVAGIIADPALAAEIAELQAPYVTTINLEEAAKYGLADIRGNIFTIGVRPDSDEMVSTVTMRMAELRAMADKLGCRVDCNERDGYFLTTTKRRWTNEAGYIAKPISASSTTLRITSDAVSAASEAILRTQRELAAEMAEAWGVFIARYSAQFGARLQTVAARLAEIDVVATCAKNAADFGYVRPQIIAGDESWVAARGLRHPIIERINDRVDYVANDVDLGRDKKGLLLYGINASGKSSLMKAIGLNVIMAQAGMYVAACEMSVCPYTRLFTRISGNDNIYRGMSSFTVEMTELRNILQRCDRRSLVLGDELCAGTEAQSAVSIVAAGIHTLAEMRVSFVFATHLHELVDIPLIAGRDDIFVGHMHVEIDASQKIVYDRHLKPGAGSPLYGLEVCRGLAMPEDFLAVAQRVRRHIQGIEEFLVDPKRASRYNGGVYMDRCGVCREARATETHHIRYQCDAVGGFVGNGVGVHRGSNLVPLCESCHLAEHRGEIKIKGYRWSSEGKQLEVERSDERSERSDERSGSDKRSGSDAEEAEWGKFFRYTREGLWWRGGPGRKWTRCTERKLRNHSFWKEGTDINALKERLLDA